MEELLIFIFQFFFEIVLQVLLELPFDLFVGSRESKRDQSSRMFQWSVVGLVLGGVAGGISLFIFPQTFIKTSQWRIVYLIVAPTISAVFSFVLARAFVAKGKHWIDPKLHAVCALCFALVLTVLRFTYAQRPF